MNQSKIRNRPCPHKQYDWESWIDNGRTLAQQGQWESAAIFYKRAFNTAERILCEHCPNSSCYKNSLENYLVTVKEFAFVMKQNQYDCALEAFIENLKVMLPKTSKATEQSSFQQTLLILNQLDQTPSWQPEFLVNLSEP